MRTAVMVGLLLLTMATVASAQSEVTPEQKIKVAYLYNFIRYVQWPDSTFLDKEAPFVIGILDDDPHSQLLERIAKRKLARGRTIVVRRFTDVNQIRDCHLVFLSDSTKPNEVADVITRTEQQHSLLVCDIVATPNKDAPIQFYYDQDGTIGLKINIAAMERRDLKADAKLLNVASVVRG
ncbi:MAG: YfiR family protein [Planctomycetales bacterium]|nr:YfiR family protein [Planctomycetales bacterium]